MKPLHNLPDRIADYLPYQQAMTAYDNAVHALNNTKEHPGHDPVYDAVEAHHSAATDMLDAVIETYVRGRIAVALLATRSKPKSTVPPSPPSLTLQEAA